MKRLVYICDWLPPDFGAVGQYSVQLARQRAASGEDVLLAGLSSQHSSVETETVGGGHLTIKRFRASQYDRSRFLRRTLWTATLNTRLIARLLPDLRKADEILFTGSPAFMLHFLGPLNLVLRKRLVYRITDFHPECLMAGMHRRPLILRAFYRLTVAWRRRIQQFEVLGEDQRRRLLKIGIPAERICLKRDLSPVTIAPETLPLARPPELSDYAVLLYSGNFGYAHDHETFVEGYRRHHDHGSGRVALWLNAVGAKADLVEQELRRLGLPVHRSRPLPLELLPRLLVTPDAHLITLRDAFVGYVMPSKVYGCIESMRDVLYIGSGDSDVHWLCSRQLPPTAYYHVLTGRSDLVADVLESIADRAGVPTRSADVPANEALTGIILERA